MNNQNSIYQFLKIALIAFVLICAGALVSMDMAVLLTSAHAETGMVKHVVAPTPERQIELVRMVRQECGFCHGLRLTGGLGSPMTREAMQGKDADALTAVIRLGIPGTAMPGWAPFLNEAETAWIVEQLQKGFPE